jgi:FeS assembly SUF system regulator
MFRLRKITDYGIVLLVHLAGNQENPDGDGFHTARSLAEDVALPQPVVSKILKILARGGIIESHRGAKGGYSLRVPASEISVAEMIAALEGPVSMTECSTSAGLCSHESSCSVRDPWQVINRIVRDALTDISLADIAQQSVISDRPLDRLLRSSEQPAGAAWSETIGGE